MGLWMSVDDGSTDKKGEEWRFCCEDNSAAGLRVIAETCLRAFLNENFWRGANDSRAFCSLSWRVLMFLRYSSAYLLCYHGIRKSHTSE